MFAAVPEHAVVGAEGHRGLDLGGLDRGSVLVPSLPPRRRVKVGGRRVLTGSPVRQHTVRNQVTTWAAVRLSVRFVHARSRTASWGAIVGSGSGNHYDNCAHAEGHKCRCTWCGGSLHGWQGWVALASDPDGALQSRRHKVDTQLRSITTRHGSGRTKKNKAASTDAARLDIADWLAREEGIALSSRQGAGTPHEPASSPPPAPSTATTGAETPDEPDDGESAPTGGAPRISDAQRWLTGTNVEPEDYGPPDWPGAPGQPTAASVHPSPIDQVEMFAEAMTASVWKEIATELGGDTKAGKEIKRELAHHGWCDLFVGLARAIDEYGKALDHIPEWIKRRIKEAIRDSSMRDKRPHVTSAVIDIVVDRVWSAFKGTMFGNIPLLSVITHEETLRSLRILAVFICPAPEDHKEVREHALEPLRDDARMIITAQTKARLARLFDEWTASI